MEEKMLDLNERVALQIGDLVLKNISLVFENEKLKAQQAPDDEEPQEE
jgi:hypothetical protein